ncbi:hypothetical protein [Nocardia jiangxiensis]|uniref:hypothetical protein n=1 Tax=Nocardia jiangxiensis TaxID=282685 RepID=UPI00030A42E1|nr:hypothetical protein [Nocardia jiangxiensis]
MLKSIPDKYLDTYPIPPEVAAEWNRWEGVRWRVMRYMDKHNGAYPPDQRFTVSPPRMCDYHYEHWYAWRNRHFNPVSGNRWPGHPGSFLLPGAGSPAAINRMREERRWEWDEKTIEQMQMTEQFCADGRGCSK